MQQEIISQGSTFTLLARSAWAALKGRWLPSIGILLFVVLCQFLAQELIGAWSNLLLVPLPVGLALYYLNLLRGCEQNLNVVFSPYNQFFQIFVG